MSNFGTVKTIAKKAYKKVPKKKIINKAATYGVKQLVGGTYLDLIGFFYKKSKKSAITYAGSYAYESFLRSKFARNKINSLPMSLVSFVIRIIANFLILSRLITGIKILDFTVSVILTIVITLTAPFFYTSIKAHEDMFLLYTNGIMDRFMGPGGWEYMEDIKNKFLLSIGILLLIVLQFVQVNSKSLQEIIVHMLITGIISDKLQGWVDNIPKIKQVHYGMFSTKEDIKRDMHILTPANFVSLSYKVPNECHTDNRVIMGMKEGKRIKISIDEYIQSERNKNKNKINNMKNTNEPYVHYLNESSELKCLDIMPDYDPSNHSDN